MPRENGGELAESTPCPQTHRAGTAADLESPAVDKEVRQRRESMTEESRMAIMTSAIETIIGCLGEDVKREGLLETPNRMARALLYCTQVCVAQFSSCFVSSPYLMVPAASSLFST
jgi:hypothetical protein